MLNRSTRVWFFAVPGSGLLNVAGPWEVLGHTNDILGRSAYTMEILGPSAPLVRSRFGLHLAEVRPLPQRVERVADIAIVAAGTPHPPVPEPEQQLVDWLRKHHRRFETVVSICTGAFVLGGAGVLDGKRVTTHWNFLDVLRERFGAAQVVDQGIYSQDGNLWTSAGVAAGIDLTLALVERDHGRDVAMAVARRLVLFLRRSGNQAQFSAALQRQSKEPARLRDLSTFVVEHAAEPLSVERLAKATGMSVRSLSRWCRQELGESPAEFVRRLRLDEARRLLEDTTLPLKDISSRTGLGDAATLWRVFTRRLGITPAAYRERFSGRERRATASVS